MLKVSYSDSLQKHNPHTYRIHHTWFSKTIERIIPQVRERVGVVKGEGPWFKPDLSQDPYLILDYSNPKIHESKTFWSLDILGLLVLVAGMIFIVYHALRIDWYSVSWELIPVLIIAIWLMAGLWQMPLNHGPDEIMHVASGMWYWFHALPITKDAVFWTDNHWAATYIWYPDLSYWISVKTLSCLNLFGLDSFGYKWLRLIQFVWFVGLLIITFLYHRRIALVGILTLAMVPQFGFLSSYFNGDLLSIGVLLASVSMLVSEKPKPIIAWVLYAFLMLQIKLNVGGVMGVFLLIFLFKEKEMLPKGNVALGLGVGMMLGLWRYIWNALFIPYSWMKAYQLEYAQSAVSQNLAGSNMELLTDPWFYVRLAKGMYAYLGQMNYVIPALYYFLFAGGILFLVYRTRNRFTIAGALPLVVNMVAAVCFAIFWLPQVQGRYILPGLLVLLLMTGLKEWGMKEKILIYGLSIVGACHLSVYFWSKLS